MTGEGSYASKLAKGDICILVILEGSCEVELDGEEEGGVEVGGCGLSYCRRRLSSLLRACSVVRFLLWLMGENEVVGTLFSYLIISGVGELDTEEGISDSEWEIVLFHVWISGIVETVNIGVETMDEITVGCVWWMIEL